MTGRLHAAAHALARSSVPAVLAEERLLACERAAAALANRRPRSPRPAPPAADAARSGDRVLRRALDAVWSEAKTGAAAATLVAAAFGRRRRSLDRALVRAWLLHWPHDHPAGEVLRAAAAAAAERHDWPWRARGRRWRLWDGPDLLRAELADAADARALLREAGLVGALERGRFATAALARGS